MLFLDERIDRPSRRLRCAHRPGVLLDSHPAALFRAAAKRFEIPLDVCVFRRVHPGVRHDAPDGDLEYLARGLLALGRDQGPHRGTAAAVITQNIDGLHRLAGTSAQCLIELHGTNALVECQTCHWRGDPERYFDYFRLIRRPPLCACGGFLKPATISFGQNLDPKELERARQAAMEADLIVALGSTLSVYPAASYPLIAAQRGVPYIIINRGATGHDLLEFHHATST